MTDKIEIAYSEDETWESPCKETDLPYDWVPVEPSATEVLVPVWHDGANPNQTELYSGELRCTLRTLTPLIVGNQQVEWEQLEENVREAIENIGHVDWRAEINQELTAREQQRNRNFNRQAELRKIEQDRGDLEKKKKDKKLLLPLRLPGGKMPVLIPGESLKGMLRHTLGALLSAPMERVSEATFSYRPNVKVPGNTTPSSPIAAMVEKFDQERLELRIRIIPDLRNVEFIKGDDASLAPGKNHGDLIPAGNMGNGWCRESRNGRYQWRFDARNPHHRERLTEEHYWLRCHFGLDKNLAFMAAAEKSGGPHPSVLVRKAAVTTSSYDVPPEVVRQYLETRKHLQDDKYGHLSRNEIKKRLEFGEIKPGDVIFCEWSERSVISFGHNFRYRWKHLNSVTQRTIAFDPSAKKWAVGRRPEMSAPQQEKPSADGKPGALTAIRNLFGYVVDQSNDAFGGTNPAGESICLKELKDPFDRLAGRISFNIAMERVDDGDIEPKRFLNADRGGYVFLHPTAAPKAQFSRSYVPGKDRTWGDGLLQRAGKIQLQGATRLCAGRKFYPHQGNYRQDPDVIDLKRYHYDLQALLENDEQSVHSRWELLTYLWGNQASVARWVCQPGREFGFTVRFKDLRARELAALVAALEPERLRPAKNAAAQTTIPVYAQKLGHGRALGLGSVRVKIDSAWRWPQTLEARDQKLSSEELNGLVRDDLLPTLDKNVLNQWLEVLSVSPSRKPRPYLLKHDGKTIVKWSQAQRATLLDSFRGNPFPDSGESNASGGADGRNSHGSHSGNRDPRGRGGGGNRHSR